jgi:hypothetical protein
MSSESSMREFCVTEDQAADLDALAPGSLIRNGVEPHYAYFVKTGTLWHPCDQSGAMFNWRPESERFDQPLWLGPFKSTQIHRFGLTTELTVLKTEQVSGIVNRMTPGGRPPIGEPINIRLTDDLLEGVDKFAAARKISRAEAIRRLLDRALVELNGGAI